MDIEMEITREGKRPYYYNLEIEEAGRNIERGISLESFFKHQAETFKHGKNAYCEMIKKEIEYIYANVEDFIDTDDYGRTGWIWTIGNVNFKEVMKIIDDLQKTDHRPPTAKLKSDFADWKLEAVFKYLAKNNLITGDIEDWMYWFNRNTKEQPGQLKYTSKSALANLLFWMCGTLDSDTRQAAKAAFGMDLDGHNMSDFKKSIPYTDFFKEIEDMEQKEFNKNGLKSKI